ncbi:MAG: FAD-binding protein [Acidimicrobiales bacterium]|nr:FAD-binding protein [Acidimicrobiales bacterium]MEE1563428.1 FAD-binding protein [Acidimicrobiales bacterium]
MPSPAADRPLRITALVKQIPKFEEMRLGDDGRLVRSGVELHMNDYCRRAVRVGCNLAEASGGTCTAITLGPPEAHTVLREAILCGCAAGLHVSDPAFAGSDTLATARALAGALEVHGPWDLVLCGRNSVDADTGQVPAQVAELLGLPFLSGVRELDLVDGTVHVLLEHDDEWVRAEVALPAVLSCAERLCDPCKVKEPEAWATVDARLLTTITATEIGPGPWGQAGSPTSVGEVRVLEVPRTGERLQGAGTGQVDRVVEVLRDRGALVADDRPPGRVPEPSAGGPEVVVLVEPDRQRVTAELLGSAAGLGSRVTAIGIGATGELSKRGADRVLGVDGTPHEDDLAALLADHLAVDPPWALLAPGTAWGRHVTSRLAARLGAGLIGDAVGIERRDDRLVALKPAFGGRLVAEITCSSPIQMATVRPGVLPLPEPRGPRRIEVEHLHGDVRGQVRVLERWRDDDADLLANADVVVGVGVGVDPEDLPLVRQCAEDLGAELCATRKVTDAGWMPRARQVGITGHSIAPRLYIAIGISGRFNHTIGVRQAGTIVGVNTDPDCEFWEGCDIGLVADWREALPALVERLA